MTAFVKRQMKKWVAVANGYRWRLKVNGANPPRFSGAYDSRSAALASQHKTALLGYDHEETAEVSFEAMCQIAPWDYPILFWLEKYLRPELSVVDAGGHMGTKFLAFQRHLDLTKLRWTVYDLEAVVRAARSRQQAGLLPKQISFTSELSMCPAADILLASGLLQYLDTPLGAFFKQFEAPPQTVLLNKVALRDGPTLFTLEQIGSARVPYQIRSKSEFERQITQAGYSIKDTWDIPELGHVIATHPLLGKSQSRGYLLEKLH